LKNVLVCIMVCLAIALSMLLPSAAFAVSDNFNDNTTWSQLWAASSLNGPTVAETNQRLEITFPADCSGSEFNGMYSCLSKLTGDFDVQVDYQLLDWPYGHGVRLGLCFSSGSYYYANILRNVGSTMEPSSGQEM
jgi:hypothetical protein